MAFLLEEQFRRFKRTHHYHSIAVSGGQMDFLDCGDGAPILLLSGLFGKGETWFPLIERLKREHRLIAPDYPHFDSLETLLKGLADLLESRGLSRVAVLGHSFGGFVAQAFARAFPERVSCLALSHSALPPTQSARAARILGSLLLRLPLSVNRWLWRKRFKKWARNDGTPDQQFLASYRRELLENLTRNQLSSFLRYFIDLLALKEFRAGDLRHWNGRVLIIESDDDPAVSAKDRKKLRDCYPGAALRVFHGAGHGSLIESPQEYSDCVSRFVGQST